MGVWLKLGWRLGGASNSEGGEGSSVPVVGHNAGGGEASFAGEDGGRG